MSNIHPITPEVFTDSLFKIVESISGYSRQYLISSRRSNELVSYRTIFAVLCKQYFPTLSDAHIGEYLNRDHTTVRRSRITVHAYHMHKQYGKSPLGHEYRRLYRCIKIRVAARYGPYRKVSMQTSWSECEQFIDQLSATIDSVALRMGMEAYSKRVKGGQRAIDRYVLLDIFTTRYPRVPPKKLAAKLGYRDRSSVYYFFDFITALKKSDMSSLNVAQAQIAPLYRKLKQETLRELKRVA